MRPMGGIAQGQERLLPRRILFRTNRKSEERPDSIELRFPINEMLEIRGRLQMGDDVGKGLGLEVDHRYDVRRV